MSDSSSELRSTTSEGLTNDVQHEADEPVMCREWKQYSINEYNVLEVINNTLAVQEIHRRAKEVPV